MEALNNNLRHLESENQQQEDNIQKMEARYTDEQTKWVNLCERTGTQMDLHQEVYKDKFPIDPFRRDNVFHHSMQLQKDMQTAINSTGQRKQNQHSFGHQKTKLQTLLDLGRVQDHNHLNVIKTDYKTSQRQKEIINVISDMSMQIMKGMSQCMHSFGSQIDG